MVVEVSNPLYRGRLQFENRFWEISLCKIPNFQLFVRNNLIFRCHENGGQMANRYSCWQMIIAGREDRQALADIIQILRNTQNPQVGHKHQTPEITSTKRCVIAPKASAEGACI